MKGKILDFSIQNSSGVISADDGKRYNFSASEWKSDKSPVVNQVVDFAIDGENATGVYLDSSSAAAANPDGKSKIVAALLAFFFGGFGVHKFYLGCNKAGIIMLLVFFLGFILIGIPSLVMGIIAFVEFIIYLTKSDDEFQRIYVENQKCWF
jgi:TM2 domain-containing membrane protein YozV